MTADRIVVRPASSDDLPAVIRFIHDLAAYEDLAHECVANEAQIGAALFGSPARIHALIAEIAPRPIGMAVWLYTFSTFAGRPSIYVEDLFVDPGFRGRGVARRLLAALARRAVADGCTVLEWKVLHWNATALSFYRNLGAKPVEDWIVQRLSGPDLAALAA